jgi:regulator of protease activity HflC (stomatin/prohibitin superfamily)
MSDEAWQEPNFSALESCGTCCAGLSTIIPVCWCCIFKTLDVYEDGVRLRHGKKLHKGVIAGGTHVILPLVDKLMRIDTREQLLDIPRQNVVTKEGFSLVVDAVVYFKVFDSTKALLGIQDVKRSIFWLAQTKLREILGIHTWQQIQVERKSLISGLKAILDEATDAWGVDVTRVEMTDIQLPQNVKAAMAAEAEAKASAGAFLVTADRDAKAKMIQASASPILVNAEREAKARIILAEATAQAKVIEAQGEKNAAVKLKEAADIMGGNTNTIQLRYLQTLPQLKGTIMVPMSNDMTQLMSGAVAQRMA